MLRGESKQNKNSVMNTYFFTTTPQHWLRMAYIVMKKKQEKEVCEPLPFVRACGSFWMIRPKTYTQDKKKPELRVITVP